MDSERGSVEDLKSQAADFRGVPVSFSLKRERADRFRYRFYVALLVFVVIVGLPIVGIPSLRHRLSGRVQQLRTAVSEASHPAPLLAKVGENQGPLPKEYEIPVLPRQPLFIPGQVYGAGAPTARPARVEPPRGAQRVTYGQPETSDQSVPSDAEPVYRQGAAEREAYDLVLKSSDTVASMVSGKDPSLRFKAWSAAKTDEDTYLVRIVFTQSADNNEVPYIWQVKVSGKQVSPLNYYARSIPK